MPAPAGIVAAILVDNASPVHAQAALIRRQVRRAMIRRLFIANRGEIALRVIRTAHRLGIETILGVSEADRSSLPARLADETVSVGAASSSSSYLAIGSVVAAARQARADAVHPGYGFLSENAGFARALCGCGHSLRWPRCHEPGSDGRQAHGAAHWRRGRPAGRPGRRGGGPRIRAQARGCHGVSAAAQGGRRWWWSGHEEGRAAGGSGCDRSILLWPRRAPPSATRGSTSSDSSVTDVTWRSRFWGMAGAPFTLEPAIARSSGAFRSSSRRLRRPACPRHRSRH